MAIKKYIADKDNTITNAHGTDLRTRASGSNMGAADILEVFSIYGQQTTSSIELSRTLVQFPVSNISADRTSGTIPASGSVRFFLRLFNARHSEQLPENFTVNVLAVSASWQEGSGLDMESYTDKTKDKIEGSNWMNRLKATQWDKPGGDYHSSSYVAGWTMPNYTFTFNNGSEDLLVDVTMAVEEWMKNTQANYGFGVFLTSSLEGSSSFTGNSDDGPVLHNPGGSTRSYYTKRFFSRTSEFFFKRPALEARWDSKVMDDSGNFYASSSIAPAADNLNNLYLYNYIRGRLVNIPSTETLTVEIYSSSAGLPTGSTLTAATATNTSTGVYKAEISLATTGTMSASILNDVWSGSVGGEYKTGSFTVRSFNDDSVLVSEDYSQFTTKITNLKSSYREDETARLRVFTRPRNFSPTIYTVASKEIQHEIVPSASFEVVRSVDNGIVITNSTGSTTQHTHLSYDNSGSYFDLDMSLLEPGYMYGIKLFFYISQKWREQEEVFNFRVEKS